MTDKEYTKLVARNLKRIAYANGKTQADIARDLKINKATVSSWMNGTRLPRMDKIDRLCHYFNCRRVDIMEEEGFMQAGHSPHPDLHPISKRTFPLYDGIACGEPRLIPDGIETYIDATTEIRADYVLKCHGDSMIGARINDGDLVFIRQQPDVENGQIAAVLIDDSATLKRVYKYANNTVLVLRAENPDFEDIELTGQQLEDVKILGLAVAFQSDVK